jgi:hypothetical protein
MGALFYFKKLPRLDCHGFHRLIFSEEIEYSGRSVQSVAVKLRTLTVFPGNNRVLSF